MNTIKKISSLACLGDLMGQTYPIYACSSTNHERHFIGSRYILRLLAAWVFVFMKKSRNFKRHRLKTFLESLLSRS